MRPAVAPVAATALLACLVACTNSAPPSITPAPTPTPHASANTLPSASPSPAASSTLPATVFESVVYPYSLTTYRPLKTQTRFIPETLLGPWHPAERAWDGEERLDLPGPLADQNRIAQGDFFVIGAPAPDGLGPWVDRVARNGEQFHGCTTTRSDKLGIPLPDDPPPGQLPIGFIVVGIALQQKCEQGTAFTGRAFVCDGFGFAMWVATPPSKWNAAGPLIADYIPEGMHVTEPIRRACGAAVPASPVPRR